MRGLAPRLVEPLFRDRRDAGRRLAADWLREHLPRAARRYAA